MQRPQLHKQSAHNEHTPELDNRLLQILIWWEEDEPDTGLDAKG
jgi:hypothetical protein